MERLSTRPSCPSPSPEAGAQRAIGQRLRVRKRKPAAPTTSWPLLLACGCTSRRPREEAHVQITAGWDHAELLHVTFFFFLQKTQ